MKIGDSIYVIKIEERENGVLSDDKNGITIKKHTIIGMSKFRICIDDDWFTTFSPFPEHGIRRDSHNQYANNNYVSVTSGDRFWGSGFSCTRYSTTKPTKRTLNRMAADICVKIEKEYGWIMKSAGDRAFDLVQNFDMLTLKPKL